MRYTDGAPNTVYLVLDMEHGDVYSVHTNMREARESKAEFGDDPMVRIAIYDQRKR